MWLRNVILVLGLLGIVTVDGAQCATSRRGAPQQNQQTKTMSARAATNVQGARGNVRGGTTQNSATKPNVAARAAVTTKQGVIGTGTKVTGATQNTVVGEDCQNLYNACMDNFCVVDNADGGRCICSDKYKSFNKIIKEIDDLNKQAYKMATLGVEKVEAQVSKNPALADMDIESSVESKTIQFAFEDGEWGSALKKSGQDACLAQIPQCKDKMTILTAMYSGQINSDCIAYDNALKKKRSEAKVKLQQAEGGLREIALDSAKNANKYDLGQCTIKFKECMKKPEVCGPDFTGCVDVVEQTKVRIRNKTDEEIFVIPDTTANLSISKSMYNSLSGKATMCSSVLENCVKVADSVFNTFLRESVPELRVAEDLAEYGARTNCITSVSDCFRNACRDHIDPNDKTVSYDACLTRPEMMLSFCKVELDTCGVDSTDATTARKSQIWDFVLARLAGMKVDACTNDLKTCLADENRCGKDYTKCVGLSTDTIIRMCPYDKLTGCKNVYDSELKSNEVYENLTNVVQGIILNIDNAMLDKCLAAVDAAAERVCGPQLDCGAMISLDTIGSTSLDYKICEYKIMGNDVAFTDHCYRDQASIPDADLGRVVGATQGSGLGPVVPYSVVLDVPIYWESITIGPDGKFIGIDNYIKDLEERNIFMTPEQTKRLETGLGEVRDGVDKVVAMIESDETVKYCMQGRTIRGVTDKADARFPNLTQSIRMQLANKILQRAKKNYYAKYDTYNERQLKDFLDITERQARIRGENSKDIRREMARQSCVALAEMSALPKSAEPPSSVGGGILIGVILAMVIVAVCVLTCGGGAAAIGAVAAGTMTTATSTTAGVTVGTAASAAASTLGGTTVTLGSVASGAVASVATTGAAVSAVTGAAVGTTAVVGGSVLTASTAAAGIAGIVAGTIGAATAVTTAGLAINDAVEGEHVMVKSSDTVASDNSSDYTGTFRVDHWNYREDINTVFDPVDLSCEKCIITTRCAKTKAPMFGDQYCLEWEESAPKKCTKVQF